LSAVSRVDSCGLALTGLGIFEDKYVSLYGQLIGDGRIHLRWCCCWSGAFGAVFGSMLGRFITGRSFPRSVSAWSGAGDLGVTSADHPADPR
jgi:hypothetical protein